MEVHHFEPTSKDISSLKGVSLVLASGKDLENYLGKLSDSLGSTAKIIEVGKTIPSLKSPTGSLDPHWFHSPDYMKRAAGILAKTFSDADPVNAAAYKTNAEAEGKRIDELKSWAEQQLSQIPKGERVLVSAHAAFAYFCKDFGFKAIPILGLQAQDEVSPTEMAEAIPAIRESHVRAVFPEEQANPKLLAEIARETGVKFGTPLNADGNGLGAGSTFEGVIRQNVESIVKALKP
jgi:zinc/manganese transport system substrate-binding protein